MTEKDIDPVLDLLNRYLGRYHFAQEFSREEVEHWLLNKEKPDDQVVYSYLVEENSKVTDFVSFYSLESSVIQSGKHNNVRAAYLYYYATEAAFSKGSSAEKHYKERLTTLVQDALIEAKKV